MDKKQVIAHLGKSDRMVSKYVAQGLLTPTYEKGPTSEKAVYDEEQVKRLKEVLDGRAGNRERVKPQTVNTEPLTERGTPNSETTLARVASGGDVGTPNSEMGGVSVFVLSKEQLEQLLARNDVSAKDKLVLRFAEAAKLSGFPESQLREAAKRGELKAIKVGRGQCVHRDDLSMWVKRQFE